MLEIQKCFEFELFNKCWLAVKIRFFSKERICLEQYHMHEKFREAPEPTLLIGDFDSFSWQV